MKQQLKSYWVIDGDNNIFPSLWAAKYHIYVAYTPKERVKYLNGSFITHFVKDIAVSEVLITVNDLGVFFTGRPKRI